MATKSPLAKALKGNQGKLPQALQDAIKDAPESPAKQTIGKKTVGGKSLKEVNSSADVPKSTSFEGTNYNLGMQDGAGAHYFNEGYDSKHGKKGTFKRPGDSGVYHVSREVVQPIKKLPAKKASIKSPAQKYKK